MSSDFPTLDDGPGSMKPLKAALDPSISGIIIPDNKLHENPIIYCDKAFEQLSGYRREEVIGRN